MHGINSEFRADLFSSDLQQKKYKKKNSIFPRWFFSNIFFSLSVLRNQSRNLGGKRWMSPQGNISLFARLRPRLSRVSSLTSARVEAFVMSLRKKGSQTKVLACPFERPSSLISLIFFRFISYSYRIYCVPPAFLFLSRLLQIPVSALWCHFNTKRSQTLAHPIVKTWCR